MNEFRYWTSEWIPPSVNQPSSSGGRLHYNPFSSSSTSITFQNTAIPDPATAEVAVAPNSNQPTSSGAANTLVPSVSRYQCSLCSFNSERVCRINLHLKSHGKADSTLCPCCGALYYSLKGYTLHFSNCLKIENVPAHEI